MQKLLNITIDIFSTLFLAYSFLQKHNEFLHGFAAILAISWWSFQFIRVGLKSRNQLAANANPAKNPITTYLGALLIVIAVGMLIVPMFYEVKQQLNYMVPCGIGIIGLALLLIPDDLKSALKKYINNKSEQ